MIKATVAGTDVFVLVNDESTGGAIVKLAPPSADGHGHSHGAGGHSGSTDGKTPAELDKLNAATHAAGTSSAAVLLVAAAAVAAMF